MRDNRIRTIFCCSLLTAAAALAAVPAKTMIRVFANMAANQMAIRWSLHGPQITLSHACATGVDVVGIAGALKDNLLGASRGASTITQLLVGNMHPDLIDRRDIRSGTRGRSPFAHAHSSASS